MRILSLLVLLAFGALAPGQSPCAHCKNERTVPCPGKEHDADRECGKNIPEHRCTSLCAASCCQGIGRIPCPKCRTADAVLAFEQECEIRASWLKSQREYLAKAKLRGVTVDTANIRLHFLVERWDFGKDGGKHTRSRAAHKFAQRLQKTADRFQEICGVLPGARQTMIISSSRAEQMSATLNHAGGGYPFAFRRNGSDGAVFTWPNPGSPALLDQDDNMHSHVVHLMTHLLHQASITFHMKPAVWLDVGLAHWMAEDLTELHRDFCFNEANSKDPWKDANWKKKIHSEVSGKDEPSFAELITRESLDQTSYREHAFCWSFVDFLIHHDAEKFKAFYRELKSSNDTKKALDTTYGWSTASCHDAWRAYVLKSYGGR